MNSYWISKDKAENKHDYRNNSSFFKSFKPGSITVNIMFSVVTFLVFVLTLEITLRATHFFGAHISWSEPDPVLGYRYVPNSKYWHYKENDHPITGKINSYGWRDKEWSLKKPPDIYRVAVLGDSFVDALQVELSSSFLALTEYRLNRDHKIKVELMNFGRSGYTQTEELLILKNHVVRFSPDIVLLFFFPGNDISDVSKETAANPVRPFYSFSEEQELILDTSFTKTRQFKSKKFINRFKRHSALISLFAERYNAYQVSTKVNALSMRKLGGFLSLCTAKPEEVYLKNYQLNKTLIAAMAKHCKDKGIKFMLVTLPTIAYMPNIENEYTSIDPTFNANYFEDDLRDYAELLKIEYLGLQRLFREAYKNLGSFLHFQINGSWGHWNYQGHKIVADAVSNKLDLISFSSQEW